MAMQAFWVNICVGMIVVILTHTTPVCAVKRVYYVGVVEKQWDYAPGGQDPMAHRSWQGNRTDDAHNIFLNHGPNRIGRKYLKAMYREFTDDTFALEMPREDWMGLLGPALNGEEGDVIQVIFRNMAHKSGRNFSLHPYSRGFEDVAAKATEEDPYHYQDDPRDQKKTEVTVEGVAPGEQHTYQWEVTPAVTPAPSDPDCVTWAYQSRVQPVRDVNSGLVGILLTCKQGTTEGLKQKYARQFALLVSTFDENKSWYIDHNIQTFLPPSPHLPTSQAVHALKEDEGFQRSNRMRSFNGLMYGHLQGLEVCVGDLTLWHVVSLGNELDVHSVRVSEHSFLVHQHRMGGLQLNPGQFVTAELQAQTVGEWCLQCDVLNHAQDGMVAMLNVSDCGGSNHSDSVSNQLHVQQFERYYIAIEEVDWDYGPSGENLFDQESLLEPGSFSAQYFSQAPGGVYRKAQYRQYQDVTFTKRAERGPEEEHLGVLGPVLRVQTGDAVALTVKNKARDRGFSLHPHGATRMNMWEGERHSDRGGSEDHEDNVEIKPGQVKTTYWFFPEAMGPGPMDPPCITRMYTSSSRDVARDAYSGLLGPILICRRGALDEHGRQRQVDREFVLLFSVTDENLSWYSDSNLTPPRGPARPHTKDYYQSNLMHGINGYVYGNLPGLTMCEGDRVSWHLLSVGSARDVHAPYFHGQPLTVLDTRATGVPLMPGSLSTMLMKADNPGQWALVDQTSEHYQAGARALFNVSHCGLRRDYNVRPTNAKRRTYFLQAEEELWDYAPSGKDNVAGKSLNDVSRDSFLFTRDDGPYLGKRYRKVRYHQYTDSTFTKKVKRPDSEGYLGLLGPTIMAETFDVIVVHFRNKASRGPYSVHAQGLYYTKSSEGSSYAGRSGVDVGVMPGESAEYEWSVPLDFAPAVGDPACVTGAYYSAVDPVKDADSGLIGPLVICKPGTLDRKSGERKGVDKFFVLLFKIFDEGQSWYLRDNLQQFGSNQSLQEPSFAKSNLMHSINGYILANNPLIKMAQQDVVTWHLMTLGGRNDLHSVLWHPNAIVSNTTDDGIMSLYPGAFRTVQMNATHVGQWMLHCHVHDDVTSSMEAVLYEVMPPVPIDPFAGVGAN